MLFRKIWQKYFQQKNRGQNWGRGQWVSKFKLGHLGPIIKAFESYIFLGPHNISQPENSSIIRFGIFDFGPNIFSKNQGQNSVKGHTCKIKAHMKLFDQGSTWNRVDNQFDRLISILEQIFSLRQGDLIGRSCQSVCLSSFF